MRLTGQFTFKQSFSGRLFLYVEEERRPFWPWARGEVRRCWRRARVMDLTKLELRALVDLGRNPRHLGTHGQGKPFGSVASALAAVSAGGADARVAAAVSPRSTDVTQAA